MYCSTGRYISKSDCELRIADCKLRAALRRLALPTVSNKHARAAAKPLQSKSAIRNSKLKSNHCVRTTLNVQGVNKPNVSRLRRHDHRMCSLAGAKEANAFK